jgi:hypothetical protein
MPCQARNRGGRPRGGEGVENGEGRLQRRDQDGPIQIAICCQHNSELLLLQAGCHIPNCKGPAVRYRRQCCDGIENRPRREMFRGGRLEQNDVALSVSFCVCQQSDAAGTTGRWFLPKATLPFLIHAATRICSYEAKRATSSPVSRSHTIAVDPAS